MQFELFFYIRNTCRVDIRSVENEIFEINARKEKLVASRSERLAHKSWDVHLLPVRPGFLFLRREIKNPHLFIPWQLFWKI